jgi:hypothetical protein
MSKWIQANSTNKKLDQNSNEYEKLEKNKTNKKVKKKKNNKEKSVITICILNN